MGSNNDAVTELFTDFDKFKKNDGFSRLSELITSKTTANQLYQGLIEDKLTTARLILLGDTDGKLLISILKQNNPPSTAIHHILNSIKDEIKIEIKRNNSLDSLLNVYLNVSTTFEVYNPQHLHIFLPQLSSPSQSIILLNGVSMLKNDRSKTSEIISDILDVDDDISLPDFLVYIKQLELFFSLIPEVITPIYINNSFTKIQKQISTIKSKRDVTLHRDTVIEILKLLSASSIDNQCREFNHKNYFNLLLLATSVDDDEIKVMANLIIVKLWNFLKTQQDITKEQLTETLLDVMTTNKEKKLTEHAIEGLAYLSLNGEVKHLIRNNETVLERFIEILKSESVSSKKYGVLVIINNICKLPDVSDSPDKKTVDYLKSVSAPKSSNHRKESAADVLLFNKHFLQTHKIVSIVYKLKLYESSAEKIINLIIGIIYLISMIQEKSARVELVQQGSLTLLMSYLIRSGTIKETGESNQLAGEDEHLLAVRALAKILCSVSPELAFKNFDTKSTIPFLIELLGPDITKYSGKVGENVSLISGKVTLLDKFESLLALTNLASSKNSELKKFIITKTFDAYLDNFIIDSDHPKIQIAAWELITNLIGEPSLLVKFFNIDGSQETKSNAARLTLLIKLLDSESIDLQLVIGGLLANATSQFLICEVLLNLDSIRLDLLTKVTYIFDNQTSNSQLILRVAYVYSNLIYYALNAKEISKLKNEKVLRSIRRVLELSKDNEVNEILQDALGHLM